MTGRLLRTVLFKGEEAPFIMELPPYRMPMLKSLLIHMWDRSKMFLKKMGGVILIGSIIIWALSSFPRSVSYTVDYDEKINSLKSDYSQRISSVEAQSAEELIEQLSLELKDIENRKEQERVSNSYIGKIGKGLEPIFKPIGIGWQASVALVTGFVAKEVVVSTMGVLYGVGTDEGEALEKALKKSGMTALSALSMMVFVLSVISVYSVDKNRIKILVKPKKKLSSVPLWLCVILDFMVFVLLYVPCFATVLTIYRETSAKWAGFNLIYTTMVAWGMSFLVYRTGIMLGVS